MTVQLTIFRTHSGQIDRCVSCPDDWADIQCQVGEQAIVGRYSCDTHYVDRETHQAVAKPPRPSPTHEFDYTAKQWVPNDSAAWAAVRKQRGELLSACDWTQLPDVPLATRTAWAAYRQELRDITQQADPLTIAWPVLPN